MTGFSRRGGFEARKPAKAAHEVRALWVSSLPEFAWLAAFAEGGELGETAAAGVPFGARMTRMIVALRDLEAGNFPVQSHSAQLCAGAFLTLARLFVNPGTSPQARTACAPFLKAGAACLDSLISGLRAEEAHVGRRVLGERDED